MVLHQAAYLDQNLSSAGYLGQMHQGRKIQLREEMYVNRLSSRHNDNLGTLCSGIVTSWRRWHTGRRCRRLSERGRWRCTRSFASPASLRSHCSAMWARKASGRADLTKHRWVSFNCCTHLFMPGKLNAPHLLFSDLGVKWLDQLLHFLYCGSRNPFFGHFGHNQGHTHGRLFQLYPTSLPCDRTRHIENLQDVSCCV